MILGHPRNFIVSTLGAVLIHLAIAAVALLDALGVPENAVSKTRRHLNDPALQFLHRRVSRTYLYSKVTGWSPGKRFWITLKKPRTDLEVSPLKVRYGL